MSLRSLISLLLLSLAATPALDARLSLLPGPTVGQLAGPAAELHQLASAGADPRGRRQVDQHDAALAAEDAVQNGPDRNTIIERHSVLLHVEAFWQRKELTLLFHFCV